MEKMAININLFSAGLWIQERDQRPRTKKTKNNMQKKIFPNFWHGRFLFL